MRTPEYSSVGARLLSGGNPQIAKADGDAPVQRYIAAMPGWKSDVGQRRLSEAIGVDTEEIRAIVSGQGSITTETALLFSRTPRVLGEAARRV